MTTTKCLKCHHETSVRKRSIGKAGRDEWVKVIDRYVFIAGLNLGRRD